MGLEDGKNEKTVTRPWITQVLNKYLDVLPCLQTWKWMVAPNTDFSAYWGKLYIEYICAVTFWVELLHSLLRHYNLFQKYANKWLWLRLIYLVLHVWSSWSKPYSCFAAMKCSPNWVEAVNSVSLNSSGCGRTDMMFLLHLDLFFPPGHTMRWQKLVL